MTEKRNFGWWCIFILLFIWQLPQNIIAVFMLPFLGDKKLIKYDNYCLIKGYDDAQFTEVESENCIIPVTVQKLKAYSVTSGDGLYEDEDGVISHTATFSYDYMTVGGGSGDTMININNTCKVHM